MKKLLFIILLLLWVASGVRAADKIADIESEIKTVMDRVSPSLVKVVAENARKYVATGIVLEDGLIVTSSLVTRHPFERIFVETTKGETIAARIAGQDNRSGLALLRLEKNGLRPLPQAGPAGVGNWVALVGLFYDRFPAIFQGIVSSRSENELLLNAPVAPGAAGGAVVNKKGELLGIIRGNVGFSFSPDFTFRDHAASIVVGGRKNESGSLCYAIPIQQVRRIAEILKTTGRVVPGWLGVILAGNSNLVQQVYKESPAAKAGITGGDRIDELAGKPIADFPDIATALEFRYAGDRVGVRINRAGKPLRLNVVLGEHRDGDEPVPPLPGDVPEAPEIPGFADLAERLAEMPELSDLETALPRVRNYVIEFAGARQLGIDVMEITADLGRKFAVKEGYGLLVSRVNEGSAARKAGLQAGDVIVRAKGGAVRTTSDLRQALNSLKEKETILLELYRDGQLKKFQLLPDLNEKKVWDVRRFSQKVDNLKDQISDETRMIYMDEIRKMQKSKEKVAAELQKQKQSSLQKILEESRKLELELKKIQMEKDKLAFKTQKKYAEELKMIREELRLIREKIRAEAEEREGRGEDKP